MTCKRKLFSGAKKKFLAKTFYDISMYHIIDLLSLCNVLMCYINILTLGKDTNICDIVEIVIKLEFSGKLKRKYS